MKSLTKKKSKNSNVWWIVLLIVTLALLASPAPTVATTLPLADRDPVDAAWRLARESGAYHFSTTVVETTHPAPTVANVGRSSRQERIYLEGETNLPQRAIQMMMWQNGGNLTQSRDGIEIRVEGDQAYGRQIGGLWQEIDDFSGAFAPGNDLMAFMAGARNVRRNGRADEKSPLHPGTSASQFTFTQYVFDFNGPAVATYMRDQLEDCLREQGELPGGLTLDVPDQYRNATGEGAIWIDGDGLPLRLTMHLEYPQQQDGERVEADIETDFFDFDRERLATAERPAGRLTRWLGLPCTSDGWRRVSVNVGLGVSTLGLLAFVVAYRKSKRVYVTFAAVIITSMLVTPLLQSHHVHAFSRHTATRRAEQEGRQEAQKAAQEAQAAAYGSNWNPHADPVQVASVQVSKYASERNAEHTNLSLADLLPANSEDDADPDSDGDGDGLTYAQEARLGTDPDEKDTDGDQITDDVEVAGFWYSGKMWYLNPLDPDTNNDGELDSAECPQQIREDENSLSPQGKICQNTDSAKEVSGHKVPDAFDRDNDGDGVPDRMDLSPYSAMDNDAAPFDYDNPLLLQVDDLQANEPVFIDIQLRPEDEDHLWYALNVLDWPSGDERAQIQRKAGNDSTFADVAEQGEPVPPNSDNGDMRLIPMLEIEIPYKDGHYGNLPVKENAPVTRTDEITLGQWLDTSKLVPYGIAVRDMNEDGDLLAYVPLNLVQDETGGDRVAFAARMHYWPTITATETTTGAETADWGLTHKVRVVWLVRMLTDRQDEDGEWLLDAPQFVRAYPEEWTLTGFSVREDHGLDVAITYEDPENDEDLQYDDPLWALTGGLEASFIAGRDQDDDGERDVTIAEIDSRFSLTSTSTITARFGISLAVELETETYTYDHQDFVAHIMMTETQQILSDTFTSYVDQGADAVTLLLSQESHARIANLDGGDDTITIQGNRLTFKLAPDNIPVQTSAYVNWGPFRYRGDEWQSYPIAEYLDKLEVRLEEVFDEYKDEPDYEDILRGQLTVAKSYYLVFYRGLYGLVQWGTDLIGPVGSIQTDDDLTAQLETAVKKSGTWIAVRAWTVTKTIFKLRELYVKLKESYQEVEGYKLYGIIGRWIDKKIAGFSGWEAAGFVMKATSAVLLVATAITLFASVFLQGSEVVDVILQTLDASGRIMTLAKKLFEIKAGGGFRQSFHEGMDDLRTGKGVKSTIVFIVLYLVVTWAIFLVEMFHTSGMKAGSLAADLAFAGMLASTITFLVLMAISMIPVFGNLFASIIWLLDYVAMWACKAQDSGNWFCEQGGLQGMLTNFITRIIYGAHVMVTITDQDRLDIEEFEQDFLDPDKGLVVGNSVVVSTTVENLLNLVDWKTFEDGKANYYWWQYSDKTLRSSTFDYQLLTQRKDIHSGLDLKDIYNDWHTRGGRPFKLIARANAETPLEEASINQTVSLYLAEGYAIPVQECWMILFVPVCYVRALRDTTHIDLGQSMYYDVFPATLSEFYALAEKDDGYALNWSLDSDPPFPRLKDADGDGLRNKADGGADPDDHAWDTDGDRLSDFFELQQGTDPRDPDTDDDGLNDRDEVILGTTPLRTDTDYDGLTDKEEVDGWEFVYDFAEDGSPVHAWVTADPLKVDIDRDEMTDFQEKTFGFHPRVPSDPSVLTLNSLVREENAPMLLLRLDETEHASTFRDDSGYANNGSCDGDACPSAGHRGRYDNAPRFDGVDDYITADGVSPYLTTGAVSFGGWVYPQGGMSENGALFAFNTSGGDDRNTLAFDQDTQQFYYDDETTERVNSVPVALDEWYHVFVVIDEDDNGRLYVDGVQAATFTTTARPDDDGLFSIGQEWDGGAASNFFLGSIDEALVFDHPLTQLEIEELTLGHYDTADYVVRPGASLSYQASVKNELFNRYAQGLLSVRFPAAFSEIPPKDFVLNPMEEGVLTGTLTVAETASTGVYSLTQEVDAMITDWREESNYAELLYHFTEDQPPFKDSSGNDPAREGDCAGATCPIATTGRYGNALAFDGIDDYVSNDNVAGYLTGDMLTFGAWVSPTNNAGASAAILAFNTDSGHNRNTLMYNPDKDKFFYRDDETSQVYSERSFSPDRWYHVMVVIYQDDQGGEYGHLYVNGDEEATFATSVRPADDGTFNVGQEWDGDSTSEHFEGRIDEVVVFNRALSAEEVKAYYRAPVFDLPLDEPAGADRFVDDSGFENDATCDPEGGRCPTASEGGITSASEAVLFSGDDYLSVNGSGILDLNEGDFTLSTWVYPTGGPGNSDCAFKAEYWNKEEYQGVTAWEKVLVRCEEWPIDYNWGASSPDPGNVNDDDFTVSWAGDFYFEEGDYLFRSTHDDRITMKLDGETILNNYDPGTDRATAHVTEGKHRVTVYYSEFSGEAHVEFDWSPAPAFHPQGILGAEGGAPEESYPTIQRVDGNEVRISFVTSDGDTIEATTDANVLRSYRWNHVVATYDGTFYELYVNGVEAGEALADPGDSPASSAAFEIGRTGNHASFQLERLEVIEQNDPTECTMWCCDHAGEYLIQYRDDDGTWEDVWWEDCLSDKYDAEHRSCLEYQADIGVTRSFTNYAEIRVYEDDQVQETCHYSNDGNDVKNNGSYTGVSDLIGVYRFDTNDSAAADYVRHFRNDREGGWNDEVAVTWDYTNTAPFRGKIDQIAIYRRAFDADEVSDLYDAGTTVLHMPLDDPPGAVDFADALDQATGTCTGEHCPTVGVPGRENFALRFDGDDDYVEIGEANTGDLQELTVATWVKLNEMPPGETMRFLTLTDEKAVLRYDGAGGPGQLDFYMTISDTLHHVRADNALQPDIWCHVAGTYDGEEMALYLNGSLMFTETVTGTVMGGDTVRLSSAGEPLDGLLDEMIVYRRALGAGEIAKLYESAPQLLLHLDEMEDATQFVDDSGNENHGACSGEGCPQAGVKGQLGLAASFDGVDDHIAVPHAGSLTPDEELTLVAWVKLTDVDVDQKIVGKTNAAPANRGYVLGVEDGQLYPEIWDSAGTRYSGRWGQITPGYWTFLAVTWKTGGDMIGYINGEVVSRTVASGNPIGDTGGRSLHVGIAPWDGSGFPTNGRIDHVMLYQRALSPREMRALFRLQAKWVEERQSTRITVDDDAPTSVLESDDVYRPNQDVILLVSAVDDTSPVTMVELGVSADGGANYTWETAPRCQDAAVPVASFTGDAAWCPTFEPTIGEGRYLLQTRATDSVGNVETPAQTYTFLVDDTPPDPVTALQDEEVIQAMSTSTDTWLVSVSGTVGDPTIAGTLEDGSGVDTVLVQLTATAHPTDTMTPRTATLDDADWEADFSLPYVDATGWYTLAAQATDEVGNVGPFVDLATVGVDTSPPVVSLDPVPTSLTATITTTLTFTGAVSETRAVSTGVSRVEMGFVPGELTYVPTYTVAMVRLDDSPGTVSFSDASDNQLAITCVGASCPSAGQDGAVNQAALFDGNDTLTVTEGDDFAGLLPERDLSVVAWVKINAYHSLEGYVSAIQDNSGVEKGWAIGQVDDGVREFFFALSSEGADDGDGVLTYLKTAGIMPYPGSHWYHVAATYDGTTMKLYVNGKLEAQDSLSQAGDINYPASGWFAIGSFKDDDQNSGHHGYLDEVAVFDRVLSVGQIRALYGAGGGTAGENVLEWDDTTLADSGDGVIDTTWAYTLSGAFDGIYQVNLRGSDVMSNVTANPDWDSGWDGEIDTRAPRVEVTVEEEREQASQLVLKTTYTCWAQDFNLVWTSADHPEYNFRCPCQTIAPHATIYTPTYYHEASLWYHDILTDTNRLYELEASCTVFGPAVAPDATMRACDVHGRCSTESSEPSKIEFLRPIDSAVMTPTQNSVISSTAAFTIEGRAYASQALKTVTVTVDGVPVDTHTWTCSNFTNTQWTSGWTPPADGAYILSSHAVDCNDDDQVKDHPIEVVVDTAAPAVGVYPLVLTTTHRLSQGRVRLSGHVTDTNGVDRVEVGVAPLADGDWQDAPVYSDDWQLDWYLGEEPAGKQYTITARATDVAGNTTQVTSTVTVDLERPNPITLTLTSSGEVVTPSTTLTTTTALLDLTWITSTSRADMLPYEVAWTIHATQTDQVRYPVPTTGPFTSTYLAGEAQRIVPKVTSRFADGNSQVDAYGSVYVDSPLTPDYITMETAQGERRPYLGWMDSGCTRIGVDRRAKRNAPGGAAIDDVLKLYATWDSEALRLAWTGANWDYAGDLFIYLDTALGGAVQAYNPFTTTGIVTTTEIVFPTDLDFGADSLIWVEDTDTAHLLTWNSGDEAWDISLLSPNYYRFDEGLHEGHTDFYLPFELLGITNPLTNPLALVSFATEEGKMNLWGTMPPANPVNSERVVETLEFAPANEPPTLALTHVYVWPLLGPGMCPNLTYRDADVQLGLTADPLGSTYSFLGNDLFWLWEDLLDLDRPPGLSENFTFTDVDHPPVGDGDAVTYTLHYINRGTDAAPAVNVLLTGLYALRLGGNVTQVVSLGDIDPGEQGTATFQGQIDLEAARTDYYTPCLSVGSPITCEQYLDWAVLNAFVYDASAHPLDWAWADHRVDSDPPEFYDVQRPELFVNAGNNTLHGYAYDESGVPTLTLEVESLAGTITCPDAFPADGIWSCVWSAGSANDGDTFNLRLQATDGYGQAGVWTNWRTYIVDTVPPSITFTAETTAAYSDTVVGDASLTFGGLITDNRGIADVEVCLGDENDGEECGTANVQATGPASQVYVDTQPAAITVTTLCGSGEITRPFVVTDSFAVGEVRLGLNIDHARRNDISATLTSPTGTSVQVLSPRAGAPLDYQNYDVLLDDAATSGLHEFKDDDDTARPHFDRETRPADPLRVFRGENSAGTWRLTLCDTNPITYHGVYSHSQLVLKPQSTAVQTGNWFYTVANFDELDAVTQTLKAYAVDLAGNRSEPITLTFESDQVAPSLTVTTTVALVETIPNRPSARVLTGTASDGGWIVQMYAFVQTPAGDLISRQIGRAGAATTPGRRHSLVRSAQGQQSEAWWFDLEPDGAGDYVIWINAIDAAGNTATAGPFTVTVIEVVAANDGPTALGASTTLTATVVGDSDSGYDFAWNMGDSTIAAGHQLTVTHHTYPAVGIYTAIVTASKGADTFTTTTTVVVDEAIAGLTATNDSPTVLGNTTMLTATLTAGSNVSYTWNLGDGQLWRGTAIGHVYPSTGTYTATVKAENSVSVFTATTIVTNVCTEVQSVSISGPTTALSGTAITLYASYLPTDATGVTLEWDNGTIGASAAYTWTEMGAQTVVVTATTPCGDPVTATYPVTVTDACTEVASVYITGPTSVPNGMVVTLKASYLPADATGVTLEWDNGVHGPSAEYIWPEVGVYTVVVTATAACGDPVTGTHMVNVAPSRRVYLPLVVRDESAR